MKKEQKLYELSKELVYQMTGKYTEDVQDGDFQIAWTYLSKAMDYIPCCKSLNLEVKPTFEEWLNVNFTKYDNEYYQDNGRNGIWKKHQLYELYENTTL
tara:strand:- start:947 stop:1243 length:297 start_codon:yes stop_codon:yes gene_type:complete